MSRNVPRLRSAGNFAAPCAMVGAGFLLACPHSARAQESVSLTQYRQLLREYEAVAGRPKPNKTAVSALVQRMRDVKTVTLGSGKTTTVDLTPDAEALAEITDTKTPLKTAAARRAQTLSLLVISDNPGPNTANAQSQAAAILARTEFRVQPETSADKTPGWLKATLDWIARQFRAFWRWIARWWDRLFPAPSGVNPGALAGLANFVRFLLYFLAAVGTIIGVYFLALYLSGRKSTHPKKSRVGGTGLDLDLDAFPDPLGYARDVAARGDYREAVRLVYIASLRRLAGSGLVTLQENRTNWEYQRGLRSRSQAAYDTLLPGTRLFDRVWYGRQNATKNEYEQTVALHDALPEPVISASASASEKPLVGAGGSSGKGGSSW